MKRFPVPLFFVPIVFPIVLIAARSGLGSPTPSPGASTQATILPAAARLRVVIYDDTGAPDDAGDFVEKCLKKISPNDYAIRRAKGEDIRAGVLDTVDVAVFPGGSGSMQAKSLEKSGRDRVRDFVKKGGGYLGICGGSYLATSYYPWSLNIVNATIVDREHWARGHGTLRLDFTPLGRQTLGVPTDSVECQYHDGPLLGPDHKADLPAYEALASFGTEVAQDGAPKGVMVGTSAMIRSVFGRGHVILISPHPEATKGLDFIIRDAVKWISQPESIANPLTGDATNAAAALRPPLAPTTQSALAK